MSIQLCLGYYLIKQINSLTSRVLLLMAIGLVWKYSQWGSLPQFVAAQKRRSIGWLHAHPRRQGSVWRNVFHFSQVLLIYYTRRTRFIRFCVILIRAAHPRRTSTYYTCVTLASKSGWNTSESAPVALSLSRQPAERARAIKSGASERLFSCACLLSNYWNSSLLRRRPLQKKRSPGNFFWPPLRRAWIITLEILICLLCACVCTTFWAAAATMSQEARRGRQVLIYASRADPQSFIVMGTTEIVEVKHKTRHSEKGWK